jgi:hypothetical protein
VTQYGMRGIGEEELGHEKKMRLTEHLLEAGASDEQRELVALSTRETDSRSLGSP